MHAKAPLTHTLMSLLAGAALVGAPVILTGCNTNEPSLEVSQGTDDSSTTTRDASADASGTDTPTNDKAIDSADETSTGGERATYGKISVTIPDGWSAYQNDGDVTIRAVTNDDDNGSVMIDITPTKRSVTDEATMKEVAADYIKEQAADEDQFAIKGSEDDQSVYQIDGHYAVTIQWEFDDDSKIYQGTTTLIAVGDDIYEVECEALSTNYDSVKADFDKVTSSIVIS